MGVSLVARQSINLRGGHYVLVIRVLSTSYPGLSDPCWDLRASQASEAHFLTPEVSKSRRNREKRDHRIVSGVPKGRMTVTVASVWADVLGLRDQLMIKSSDD